MNLLYHELLLLADARVWKFLGVYLKNVREKSRENLPNLSKAASAAAWAHCHDDTDSSPACSWSGA